MPPRFAWHVEGCSRKPIHCLHALPVIKVEFADDASMLPMFWPLSRRKLLLLLRTSSTSNSPGLGFRVWGLGFRIEDLGFRVISRKHL